MDETWKIGKSVNHKVICNNKGVAETISLTEEH